MSDFVTGQMLSAATEAKCIGRKEEIRATARAWWTDKAMPALKDQSGWSSCGDRAYEKIVYTKVYSYDESTDALVARWFREQVEACILDARAPYRVVAFFTRDTSHDDGILEVHFSTT